MESFYAKDQKAWRKWLEKYHDKQNSVWLVYHKKASKVASITYNEAVDEALCFGWIDSVRQSIDENKFRQFFSQRKPMGTWSKVNKEKIELLTSKGLMHASGLAAIDRAKTNGSWKILDKVEKLQIPKDLAAAFELHPGSRKSFLSLSKSARKMMLLSLVLAKRDETRRTRVDAIVKKVMTPP